MKDAGEPISCANYSMAGNGCVLIENWVSLKRAMGDVLLTCLTVWVDQAVVRPTSMLERFGKPLASFLDCWLHKAIFMRRAAMYGCSWARRSPVVLR